MSDEPEAQGAWIFVSHSHKDLNKVRRVRNELEQLGHNPLLFFLKCLGDDSEVDDLIHREIEARTHFILCDSSNARASRWVQAEAEIIKGLRGREYVVIDLGDPWAVQLERIQRIAKRATVSITYSRTDSTFAEAFARALRNQDYAVFLDMLSVSAGGKRDRRRDEALRDSVEKGWALILFSPDAVHSEMAVKRELFAALEMSDKWPIVPVLVRDRETTLHELRSWPLRRTLESINMADLTEGDLDEGISRLIASLKTREME